MTNSYVLIKGGTMMINYKNIAHWHPRLRSNNTGKFKHLISLLIRDWVQGCAIYSSYNKQVCQKKLIINLISTYTQGKWIVNYDRICVGTEWPQGHVINHNRLKRQTIRINLISIGLINITFKATTLENGTNVPAITAIESLTEAII